MRPDPRPVAFLSIFLGSLTGNRIVAAGDGWPVGGPLGGEAVPDRLLVDLGGDGQVRVSSWSEDGRAEEMSLQPLEWPLDADELEDLRWYLEDYLSAPFGVWEDRGPVVQGKLAGWGEQVFESLFGGSSARDAYLRARDRGLQVVFRSAEPGLLALPWELMRDEAGPVALAKEGISRSLPATGSMGTLEVPGERLRVLMVIARPAGTDDVGHQMVARPLLERLDAVRGEVELKVLRPPTFDALSRALRQAAEVGAPFHVVHCDGHGTVLAGEGTLVFEEDGGGGRYVPASAVAKALGDAGVPVAVLNACQSGAVGKDLEASVATALLRAGCSAVVAMAYSVYAVAAAEFMTAFYEALFAGNSVGNAVTAGRERLFEQDGRPSAKGNMPLADWLVPVHYLRAEVRFPDARTSRPAAAPSLNEALDQIRAAPLGGAAAQDPLAALGGVFVGRDDLFYKLEAAARWQRVVVLTGPGGTGKTELAKGFARWWRDTGGASDPRLVVWHSFEPGVASFGLDGVITSIGLEVFGADFARRTPTERLAAVKGLLEQYRCLLAWDNFESVAEMPDPTGTTPPLDELGRARLREFLRWVREHSASTVIVTSRAREEWLGEVCRIGVGGLNPAEAAEYAGLLLAPFPAAQQRRERRSFGDLLDWLDGHPLAMRLTLPRLEATEPAALLAELKGTTPLLAGDAGKDRLCSLGACITYSFAHLTDQTRRLLPAVSLFHGIADTNLLVLFSDAEGVPSRFTGISRQEWTAVLEDAARIGLLTGVGGGMYRIHPALPSYLAASWHADNPAGYDREREACEQALCTASAAYSRWLTGQIASGNTALAYAAIGLQRRTLGAMLRHALDRRAWDDATLIVWVLDTYWDTRGLGEEAAAWADRILDATADPGRDTPATVTLAGELWMYTALQQAYRQHNAGQPDQAAETYRLALAYLQDQPETEWTRRNISVNFHQLGRTAQDRGRLDEAEDWYRKSLAIKEELGDRPGMATTYGQLGITAQDRGRLDEAEDWYRKSLAIFEELRDHPHMALTYLHLGNAAQRLWRLDQADEWYRKSLAINEELGDRLSVASTYGQLGNTARRRRRLDQAEDWYRQALTVFEELGNRPYIAGAFHQLGNTAGVRGRLEEADDWYRKSLAIFEELGDHPGMGEIYHQLGMTAQARGRLEEADDWYRRSLTINEELGNRPGMALTYAQLGLLAEARGQARLALEWNIRCVTSIDQFPSPLTGTGPAALARLTRQLGLPALEQTWQQAAGQPVPQLVRDYLTSHPGQAQPGDSP
jgi:tetratricopeptide (TPR) repeat protein